MEGIHKINRKKLLKLAAVYLTGIAFLVFTNPSNLPVPFLIVPFLLLFVAIFMTVHYVLEAHLATIARKRRVVMAGVCATLPVLLLVFESIHQLSMKDFLITVALIVCVSFYMLRADFIE